MNTAEIEWMPGHGRTSPRVQVSSTHGIESGDRSSDQADTPAEAHRRTEHQAMMLDENTSTSALSPLLGGLASAMFQTAPAPWKGSFLDIGGDQIDA